jgi:hypothetical protein
MAVSTDSESLEDSTVYIGGMDTDICQGLNRICMTGWSITEATQFFF